MNNMNREICGDLRVLKHKVLVCNFPTTRRSAALEKQSAVIALIDQKLFTLACEAHNGDIWSNL